MDYTRIARLHSKVFSTPRNSLEREQAYSALSEADRAAVFDYDMGIRNGRIKAVNINEQEESEIMTYETFKRKSNSSEKGTLIELSKFAKESPELYQQYRERYHREQDEQRKLHNRRLTESTFKNKPYSFR